MSLLGLVIQLQLPQQDKAPQQMKAQKTLQALKTKDLPLTTPKSPFPKLALALLYIKKVQGCSSGPIAGLVLLYYFKLFPLR